jgi:ankyrin repeat protein
MSKAYKSYLLVLLVLLFIITGFQNSSFGAANPASSDLPTKGGDLYALVVGVSKYKDPRVAKLDLADKDAEAFGSFLNTQTEIFKNVRVSFLLNEKATKLEVEKYLYYTLPKAGKEDTVILFFSGHGVLDPIRPTEFLFLPYDGELEYPGTTGVKMTGLEFLKSVNAERVLIIADACYSGDWAPGKLAEMRPKSVSPSLELFAREARNSTGRAIITSANENRQLSWENPKLKNGIFTYNLLEGLKGKADVDGDGIVSLNEAYQYAYKRTKEDTGGYQQPLLESKVVGAFPLSFLGQKIPSSQLKKRLFNAAETGDLTDLELIVARIPDVNPRNDNNDTPLIKASCAGFAPVVKALLAKGADIDATNDGKNTALICAASNGNPEIVRMLLSAGANVNIKNAEGKSPLGFAASRGHTKVIQMLLEEGADYKSRTNPGETALTLAALNRKTDAVKQLLKWGEEARLDDLNVQNALINAGRSGSTDIVKFLLTKQPALKINPEGIPERRLIFGALRGDMQTVSKASAEGAKANCLTETGDSALSIAASMNHLEIAKFLIEHGSYPNLKLHHGRTALVEAALNGHTDMMRMLISHGARVNEKDKSGNSALMLSAGEGVTESVRLLIGAEADVNASNSEGLTGLILASNAGHTEIAKLLLNAGADPNRPDPAGNTPLMSASSRGNLEIIKALLAKGAAINAKSNQRNTALMSAARDGKNKAVRLLLASGADPAAEDWEGKTAIGMAAERDREEIVELLKTAKHEK